MIIDSKYHPTVAQIIGLLEKSNVWFQTFEHEPVQTSEEASKIRDGYSHHQGAKSLIVKVKVPNNNKFIMIVCPGDTRFDNNKVRKLFDAKSIRFATVDEVSQITNGVKPGGVPPFGNLFNLEVIVDPSLLLNDKIIFNAGDRGFSIGIKSEDYKLIVNPRIEEIV